MKIFEGRSFHQAEDLSVVVGLAVAEVDSLDWPGDLVNHMNPEVGRVVSRTFSDVDIEARISEVVLGGGWLVVVVLIVDFLKGLKGRAVVQNKRELARVSLELGAVVVLVLGVVLAEVVVVVVVVVVGVEVEVVVEVVEDVVVVVVVVVEVAMTG